MKQSSSRISKKQLVNSRNTIKPSAKNKAGGKVHEVKSNLKGIAGKLDNKPKLEDKGKGEKIAGKIQVLIVSSIAIVLGAFSFVRSLIRTGESKKHGREGQKKG